jgi:hypothetical protein
MNAPVDMALAECMEPLARVLQLQRRAFDIERYPPLAVRRNRLSRLLDLVIRHEDAWVAAIDRDFGHRSAHETQLAELYAITAEARHAMRHLRRWMKPRRVKTPLRLAPAAAWIVPQPLGVVGVISAWNHPVQLAPSPVVAALAAGNRAVAAAENLTPVTLELGGKSPAILDHDADVEAAATSIARGKLFNAGQTCIVPDYALVPRRSVASFVDAMRAAVQSLYASAVVLVRIRPRPRWPRVARNACRWRHGQRYVLAFRASGTALRRRRCIGQRRSSRRARVRALLAHEAGFRAGAAHGDAPARAAVRPQVRARSRAVAARFFADPVAVPAVALPGASRWRIIA